MYIIIHVCIIIIMIIIIYNVCDVTWVLSFIAAPSTAALLHRRPASYVIRTALKNTHH